jgi:hypothetical protein
MIKKLLFLTLVFSPILYGAAAEKQAIAAVVTEVTISGAPLKRADAMVFNERGELLEQQRAAQRDKEAAQQKQAFPPKMLAYLQAHEVPAALKAQLDKVFSCPAGQQALATINSATTYEVLKNKQKSIADLIAQAGLQQFGREPNVLVCPAIPGYVLKLPKPWADFDLPRIEIEKINMGRIKYADDLKAAIAQHQLPLRIPNKWAYFVPGGDGLNIPLGLVVAEKVESAQAEPALSEEKQQVIELFAKLIGFYDDQMHNFVITPDGLVLIDTEPHGITLKYA